MEKTSEIFRKKLKGARKSQGLTQSEMAERVGMSVRTYQKYEQGETQPTPEILDSFARALNLRPWELVTPDNSGASQWLQDATKMMDYLAHLNPSELGAIRFLIKGSDPLFETMSPEERVTSIEAAITRLKSIRYK